MSKLELREALVLSGQEVGQLIRRLTAAGAIEPTQLPSGREGYRIVAAPDGEPIATPGAAGEASAAALPAHGESALTTPPLAT